jgi:SAM-dependent methyltransferase
MWIRFEEDLDAWRRQYRAFRALLAVQEAGLFDALASGASATIPELAERLRVDARALEALSRPLAARGLLVVDGDRLSMSPAAMRMPHALAGLKAEWGDGSHLRDYGEPLRSGKPFVATSGGVRRDDPAAAERFLAMLHRRSAESVRVAARMVRELCAGTNSPRVLDLGGGHGGYAAAFAGLPDARVTLFDREEVLPIARKLSGDRFETRGGDFMTDELGGPYDVVFLSNIVHGEGPQGVSRLLRRVRDVVAPDGVVVVKDMFLESSGAEPDYAADFGVLMLLATEAGRTYTVGELGQLLGAAGFPEIRHVAFLGEGYSYVIGR